MSKNALLDMVRNKLKQKDQKTEYKFYGQYIPSIDEILFKRYFSDINSRGTFIECGAFDGETISSCKFFEETMKWTAYNIEATPNTFTLLKKNRPNSNNFNIALSNKKDTLDFAIIKNNKTGVLHGGVNKIIKDEKDKNLQFKNTHIDKLIKVPTITYKEFIESNNIESLDLFVLDVEGHEEYVVDGMKNCNILPSVFCVENGDKIKNKIENLGYKFDIMYYDNAFFIRKDLLEMFMQNRNIFKEFNDRF